ncbi:hypothetical protein Pflav_075820 [Phytohabitans flavus]|uniref:Uncharacterized protein n=1 Tax=Phytohabitans flavus TaxID=1076124 RepID=A0A6F8Y4Y2_9ACTN|nr:hypothetical protein Pflav_075820 [Phytohabitans flavus]
MPVASYEALVAYSSTDSVTSGSVTQANRMDTGPDPSGPYSIDICDGTAVAGNGLSAAAARLSAAAVWGWTTSAAAERATATEMAALHPANWRLVRGAGTVELSLAM